MGSRTRGTVRHVKGSTMSYHNMARIVLINMDTNSLKYLNILWKCECKTQCHVGNVEGRLTVGPLCDRDRVD
ncbi:unnamed protein product [Allacma fusca]|uniref:Uncharacterized protein n=1 Tax=Allacma fusca TaxID=39272 RepID=A0A8J2KZ13_9HEXA|nr:unnamed protein product [Allacma fusca]